MRNSALCKKSISLLHLFPARKCADARGASVEIARIFIYASPQNEVILTEISSYQIGYWEN